MQLTQLRRPVQAAALSTTGYRPLVLTSFTLPIRPATQQPSSLIPEKNGVEGRRYASVKSQGAYKMSNKKTIAKKLGAKRTGDQFVIPGNIIYKQRGTIWHAGENAIRGRDHTIHAAVEGYVKYYRDPERHPDKQYIGVAFNKEDKLPYPRNEPRRRKLNMVAHTRKSGSRPDDVNATGLPRKVTLPGNLYDIATMEENVLWNQDKLREIKEARQAVGNAINAQHQPPKKEPTATAEDGAPASLEDVPLAQQKIYSRAEQRVFVHPLEFVNKRWLERRRTRTLHFNKANYSYAESNAAIGRLVSRTMYTPPWKLGGRKSRFRARRQRREKELKKERAKAEAKSLVKKDKKLKEEQRRAARLAKQLAAGAGKKAKKSKPLSLEGPAGEAKPAGEGKESKPVDGASQGKPE